MIEKLSIQGLAIIDSLEIDFHNGFNVITGETGAGKSILIRALNFLNGGRAGSEAVRQGRKMAAVTGEFSIAEDHPAVQRLEDLGVPAEEEDGQIRIILRRHLSQKGRSQAWVNDVSISAQTLKELGTLFLDVFAQHENQRLLNATLHLNYLDAFLPQTELKEKVMEKFAAVQSVVKELRGFVSRFTASEKNRDFVEFRLKELNEFDPSEQDYLQISKIANLGIEQKKTRQGLSTALGLMEPEDGKGLGEALNEADTALSDLLTDLKTAFTEEEKLDLEALAKRVRSMSAELEDVNFELRKWFSRIDFDEKEVDAAEERLYGYQSLFRKHEVEDLEGLLRVFSEMSSEFGSLETAKATFREYMDSLGKELRSLRKVSGELRRAREKTATKLQAKIEKELSELCMPGAQLEMRFSDLFRDPESMDVSVFGAEAESAWTGRAEELSCVGPRGTELVEFLLSANKGEPPLPLSKVASGGELSRIMLAMKKSLSIEADTCVLVFDEIDTGISGRVADVVGRKMRELSDSFQVLCISHLPQVAVYADNHFRVRKMGKKDRTESTIEQLSHSESAAEIARLLSGEEVSEQSLANAKALIAQAISRARSKGSKEKAAKKTSSRSSRKTKAVSRSVH